ncbi:MAG: ornithine cyclodeaminase family protein [Phycisphaerae bacterium]|nr:ornithine cyclodeaminase family protein [Phycisphaerae bacterium]
MIYLTEEDILEAASVNEVVDAIEASMLLYERKDFLMPERMHIDSGDNTMLIMPCFIDDYFATKLVTLFPGNPERGVPVLNGIVVLNDGQTGLPVALLNGPALTALRTAAVAAVSIRHLAPSDTHAIGVIGAGVQGFYQAWLACSVCNATDIYIHDLYPEKTAALIEKLPAVIPDVTLHQADTAEDLLKDTQVVITATTSFEPVLPDNEELLRGKHFIGIGSYKPAVREFPRALFNLLETIYIDTDHALEESGDLIIPLKNNWIKKDQIITLGKYLIEPTPRSETTFFKSVGMALFDVCAAKLIYEKAKQKNLGQEITP